MNQKIELRTLLSPFSARRIHPAPAMIGMKLGVGVISRHPAVASGSQGARGSDALVVAAVNPPKPTKPNQTNKL
jgi:hypothetical protein